MLCHRCRNQFATVTCGGLPLCPLCAAAVSERFGTPIVGAMSDVTPLGYVVPPIGIAQALQGSGVQQSLEQLPGPYSLGQSLGHSAAPIMQSSNFGKAVGETASAVKTVAIVAGLLGAAVVVYFIYNAHKTADRGLHLLEQHPELAKLAIL